MNQKIVIAEDEEKIAQLLRDYFAAEGASCHWLKNGDDVLPYVQRYKPDLLLLDLMLPGTSGLEICRALRPHNPVAIIMITARVDEIDRLLGLEMGADDYICKPFSPREVVARAKAVLRRLQPQLQGRELRVGPIRVDLAARLAAVNDDTLNLTPLEFDILTTLLEHPNEVLSRSRLLSRAKGTDYEGYERNIDSHVKNLRKKLRALLADADPIRTVYGSGYALNREAF